MVDVGSFLSILQTKMCRNDLTIFIGEHSFVPLRRINEIRLGRAEKAKMSRQKFLLKKLRVAESSVPAVLALNPQKRVKPRRMPQDAEISAESLIAFVDDYFGAAGDGADKSEL